MIYTITCNPSLDYVMQIPSFAIGETNRSVKEQMFVGGKGFNVSTILHRLHVPTCAFGFAAGFSGQEIKRLLQQRGFPFQLIQLADGFSRINVKLKGEHETEINGCGPMVTRSDLEELIKLLSPLQNEDMLVLSGSIPSHMQKDAYATILKYVQKKDIKIIVDASGELLLQTLPFHPFLIKPNQAELEEIFHCHIHNEEGIIQYGRKLQMMGAQNVLISRANQAAILIDVHQQIYRCPCAKGVVKNSVGAGDSMVAGFLTGYLKYGSYQEALKMGSAAGGATAFHDDLGKEKEIMDVYDTLSVEQFS